MQSYFSSDFTLGILGGGQLGKMLLYETRKFDIQTAVLDPNPEAPGAIACNHFETGDLQDFDTVYNFGKKVDVLTIEIEAVNIKALQQLEKEGITVYPSSSTLQKIQNKGIQKEFYKQHQIPTAAFTKFESKELLLKAFQENKITLPCIWKSTEGGYDGKGVEVIKDKSQLQTLPETECIIEEKIDFAYEIAVIVARNPDGDTVAYPTVEMEFHPEANQVEYVICPARIDEVIQTKAKDIAIKVSEAFEHVGLLAIEMFVTKDNEILVNEVAPRPHNSGHYSIEASYTNQFEQHIRAILNLPLGNTASKVAGIMVNLVGKEGYEGPVIYKNLNNILKMDGVIPHIYGKKITRPFRKMGHVTIVNKEVSKARKIAEEVKNLIEVISE
ncbi:5-(carboxyamino)imidazole ribonucleotide synthase [Aquimarina sp. ERC-38]|uniref:5-(carboxyamino)imidazole ribonucleotide synthase n=1 Tax=Aquimarina sp. ERC-38 TaxID=2949996 RepID=UPI002247D598|nr:5-(carboxyamino)imidazole ribonucleotide synthase [Aquimarina sp. ERC-38]UZO82478.1 5-(carboxyamino)imidazole ribonucleotide synthase [Aquimarina sp. ERC-38]